MFPPGLEPRTFRVLGGCDNHYTTETSHAITSASSSFSVLQTGTVLADSVIIKSFTTDVIMPKWLCLAHQWHNRCSSNPANCVTRDTVR